MIAMIAFLILLLLGSCHVVYKSVIKYRINYYNNVKLNGPVAHRLRTRALVLRLVFDSRPSFHFNLNTGL